MAVPVVVDVMVVARVAQVAVAVPGVEDVMVAARAAQAAVAAPVVAGVMVAARAALVLAVALALVARAALDVETVTLDVREIA